MKVGDVLRLTTVVLQVPSPVRRMILHGPLPLRPLMNDLRWCRRPFLILLCFVFYTRPGSETHRRCRIRWTSCRSTRIRPRRAPAGRFSAPMGSLSLRCDRVPISRGGKRGNRLTAVRTLQKRRCAFPIYDFESRAFMIARRRSACHVTEFASGQSFDGCPGRPSLPPGPPHSRRPQVMKAIISNGEPVELPGGEKTEFGNVLVVLERKKA